MKANPSFTLHATKQHDPIHFNGKLATSGDMNSSNRWR